MFSKLSILFIISNILRFLSVIGICLALSGEIVIMVQNIEGYKAASSNSTSISTTSTTSTSVSSRLRFRRAAIAPSVTPTFTSATTLPTAAVAMTSSTVSTIVPVLPATCAYVGGTDVPKAAGGILFATLDRVFASIILIFALLSEIPPNTRFTQMFWNYAFPPFGEGFGVGVLGAVEIFLGSQMLSHSVSGFPAVAGWFIFIVGFLNMIFGLALGSSIKSLRAIFPTPGSPSSSGGKLSSPPLRVLNLRRGRDAESQPPSEVWTGYGYAKGPDAEKGIQISPPMSYNQASGSVIGGKGVSISPPVYLRS